MKKLLFVYFLGWGLALAQKPFEPLALANDLLSSLTADQKEVVYFALEDPAKPVGTTCHTPPLNAGFPLSDMTPTVQKTMPYWKPI